MERKSTSDEPVALAQVRFSAMNLLAMREHSLGELREKLARKSFPQALIEQALQSLVEDKLQSDERFAQAFIKMRYHQGKGPARIRQELREKAVAPELIAALVDESDDAWLSLAREVKAKRFGADSPVDLKSRTKQMRFLQYRGFTSTQIQKLFR